MYSRFSHLAKVGGSRIAVAEHAESQEWVVYLAIYAQILSHFRFRESSTFLPVVASKSAFCIDCHTTVLISSNGTDCTCKKDSTCRDARHSVKGSSTFLPVVAVDLPSVYTTILSYSSLRMERYVRAKRILCTCRDARQSVKGTFVGLGPLSLFSLASSSLCPIVLVLEYDDAFFHSNRNRMCTPLAVSTMPDS